MRSYILFINLLFFLAISFSQNTRDINPIQSPTYNELHKYVDFPINFSSGLPNISYNLFNLSTLEEDLSLDISMSYHPMNINNRSNGTELGLGWNITGLGSISRSITHIVDEYYDYVNGNSVLPQNSSTEPQTIGLVYDDVFYYHTPKFSGKFTIIKDNNNNFFLLKLDNNDVKISFVKRPGNKLILESFSIQDTQGYTYHFETKDIDIQIYKKFVFASPNIVPIEGNGFTDCYSIIGVFQEPINICKDHPDFTNIMNSNAFQNNFILMSTPYYSNYLISKITNKNGFVLADFEYEAESYFDSPNAGYSLQKVRHKLKEVKVIGKGTLAFDYDCDINLKDTPNDICALRSISLKNYLNQKIKEVEFTNPHPSNGFTWNSYPSYSIYWPDGRQFFILNKVYQKRFLYELSIFDANNEERLKYNFHYKSGTFNGVNFVKYDIAGFKDVRTLCDIKPLDYDGMTNPNTVDEDILIRVDTPKGASVFYEYEASTVNFCQASLDLNMPRLGKFDLNFQYLDDFRDFDEQILIDAEEGSVLPCTDNEVSKHKYFKSNPENYYLEHINTIVLNPTLQNPHTVITWNSLEDEDLVFELNAQCGITYPILPNGQGELNSPNFGNNEGNGDLEWGENNTQNINEVRFIIDNQSNVYGKVSFYHGFGCGLKMRAQFEAGQYSFLVNNPCMAQGNVKVYRIKRKDDSLLKNYVHQGGIRLKRTYLIDFQSSNTNNQNVSEFEYENFNTPNSSSGNLFASQNGVKVIHKNVLAKREGLGYTKYYFENLRSTNGKIYNNANDGLLYRVEVFDESNLLLKSTRKFYEFTQLTPPLITNDQGLFFNAEFANIYNGHVYFSPSSLITIINNLTPSIYTNDFLKKQYTIDREYFDSGVFEKRSITSYNENNKQLSTQVVFNSTNEVVRSDFYYVTDFPNDGFSQQLVNDNLISQLVKTKTSENGQDINDISYEFSNNHNFTLPHLVKSKKGSLDYEVIQRVHLFDAHKRPLTISQENGTLISFIYGYNNAYIVARLEGIHYNQIPPQLITNIRNATNQVQSHSESAVITALNALRNSTNAALQNAKITTYTYKPLVGVTSVTDPKGYQMKYSYDNFNRLSEIRDHHDNIVSQQETNYKPQN